MSRPLRSTTTPASSGFTANTSRSASERRTGTQCLRFLPLARSLSPPVVLTRRPGRPLSTLAFSRSVQEPQTRLTPPLRRAPPGQQTGIRQAHPEGLARTPGFDAVSEFRRLNSARPTGSPRPSASGTSSWSPPDAITTAPFPDRSPRRSSANAASGGLAPAPVGRRWRANKPPSLAQLRLCKGSSTRLLLQRS